MKSIISKIVLLSFVFMAAACGDKEAKEHQTKNQQDEAAQEKDGKKKPQISFKAVPLPDKSTYKNPTF